MSTWYSNEHVWLRQEGDIGIIGITPHAQETLGDIVFVEFPGIGKQIAAGEVAGVVESVKTAADVFMPASGEVIAINEALQADPSLANSDPLGSGWFFKIKPSDALPESLLSETAYAELLKNS